ncbi:uncharacterized protein TNCV_4203871 [Trichonephila clavipes]|nr:uncharacterized protein TNCV_4203871 [Trichonephila clavipes]
MCRSVRYPNEIPAHTIMLPPRNARCSVMFWGLLRVPCLRHILIRLSSGSRANLDSSVNMTLPQSDTVQFPCSRPQFNHAPLAWTDRGTQRLLGTGCMVT